MAVVGSIRTPGASPSNSTVSSTTPSPWMVAASPGGNQYAAPTMTCPVSSRISGTRCAAPNARAARAVQPAGRQRGDLDVEPFGAQQPGEHGGQVGLGADDDDATSCVHRRVDRLCGRGVPGDLPHRQIGQRTGDAVSAEPQYHEVTGGVWAANAAPWQRAGIFSDRVCHRLDTISHE